MNGISLIAAERLRQIEEEGFGSDHDDLYRNEELRAAAACYVSSEKLFILREKTNEAGNSILAFMDPFPWDSKWDKRSKHDTLKYRDWETDRKSVV